MVEFYPITEDYNVTLPDCGECDYNQQYVEITGRSFKPECHNICEAIPSLQCGLASLAVQAIAKEDNEYNDYFSYIKKVGGKNA